jgi:hypothetical protein
MKAVTGIGGDAEATLCLGVGLCSRGDVRSELGVELEKAQDVGVDWGGVGGDSGDVEW